MSDTTSQIESELLAEVNEELERRGTSVVKRRPEPGQDMLAGFVVTAILACLAVLAGTGAAMSLVYTPTVEDANASTAWFEAGALGGVVRGAHFHASNLLVLLSGAYLAYMVWRGLFRRPGHWRWWRGAMLLALAVAFGMTGMLLPYDQLALHGTNIRLGYLAETPVIGEALREMLQGGETIGNATLSRFFAMHAIVLPGLTLILLRWLWKDGKSGNGIGAQAGVAGAVVLIVIVVALLIPAPLGIQGNMSESHPDARPEWYALPLYELLKLMPPGVLYLMTLFVPPLVAALVVIGLPFVERASDEPARLLKPLRIGLLVAFVGGGVLAVLPLVEDLSNDTGYFKHHSVEEVMTAMGKRNERLGHSSEPLPGDTHNLARDMELLHQRLLGNYPEKIDEGQKSDWDQWAGEGVETARQLWLAGDAETQLKLREKLRETCAKCHEAHDTEVVLEPAPRLAAPAGDVAGFKLFFDQEKLAELTPTEFTRTTSTGRMMDQLKLRLRDILIHTGVRTGETRWSREQSVVDLLALADIVEDLWERNEAEFFEMEDEWRQWVEQLRQQVHEVAKARDDAEVVKGLKEVGKVCEDCHDNAIEPLEPIEWRFNRMLRD